MIPIGKDIRRLQRVFIFIDHYLPGFKFGGPVRTIANLVSHLSDRYQFFIFTFDRDQGDAEPYKDVPLEQWTQVGKARVFYSADRSLRNILRRVKEISPELLYVNSFFSRVSMRMLVARNMGMLPPLPMVLAPRGEFAPGALVIKPMRKKAYIEFVNRARLLKGIALQASTEYEKKDIDHHLQQKKSQAGSVTMIASNISAAEHGSLTLPSRLPKQPGLLRLLYLSRISRNKNLEGALQMLKGVSGKITFSIYGPIGDPEYWADCQKAIQQLPSNISVDYKGGVKHEVVPEILSEHDLLFLPTHGENYGHVIIESLSAGCPVLISDRTPWRNLEGLGIGADLSLDHPERFQQFLQRFVELDSPTAAEYSRRAYEYANERTKDKAVVEQNVRMFSDILKIGDSD